MSKYVVLLASDHSNQNCNAMKAAARRTGSHTIGGKQHVMVLLNVYDLHPNNKYLFGMGGAFHTGIEVFQSEYSFGGHDVPNTSGVFEIEPRTAAGAIYRETIELGEIEISPSELSRIVDQMRLDFLGQEYHILERNCNTFSNEMSIKLLGYGIPGYITRLSRLAQCCSCCLPSNLSNPNRSRAAEQSSSLLNPPSGVTTTSASTFKPFSGSGYTLSGPPDELSSPVVMSTAETEEMKREKRYLAAMARQAGVSDGKPHNAI